MLASADANRAALAANLGIGVDYIYRKYDQNNDSYVIGYPFPPSSQYVGPFEWRDPVTENPALHAVEVWEIHNFTEDAHPIHIHEVQFEVVNREPMMEAGPARGPEPWETGVKDTVIAYPGEITRVIQAKFEDALHGRAERAQVG